MRRVKGSCTMSNLRAISLLGCTYNNFTKVLTNILGLFVDWFISSSQAAFIIGILCNLLVFLLSGRFVCFHYR
jgi:hypothetical protein